MAVSAVALVVTLVAVNMAVPQVTSYLRNNTEVYQTVEEAVRQALVQRHPRDSFQLVTKMPLRDFKDAEDLERIFREQLTHCGVEYFDYYLLHNMGTNVYESAEIRRLRLCSRKKAEGKIHQVGMSFHDMPELLDEILSQYGEVLDFIQLQINYVDWEQPNVQSRRCLEVARSMGSLSR